MASSSSVDGFILPAAIPPTDVKSNFVNPVTHGKDLTITCAVCVTIMVICVIVRFYTKLYIKNTWGWDDWLCIPSIIGTLGFAGTALSTLGNGIGRHQWDVSFRAITPSLLRKFIVLDVLYSPTVLVVKMSLLFLYLRIFKPSIKLRYHIYFTMAFCLLFYVGTWIVYMVHSIPRPGESQLRSRLSPKVAVNIPMGVAQGAVNVASDLYIFCLPIPVVWNLQLPLKKKLGVLATFTTGLSACIASAFGLYYRIRIRRNSDVTWQLVYVLLWIVVELTVGIMCGCVTTFPGFLRYHLPHIRSSISLIKSGFSYIHFPRSQRSHSSDSSRDGAKILITKDIELTLGSRIDGNGMFISPNNHSFAVVGGEDQQLPSAGASISGTWQNQPAVGHPSPKCDADTLLRGEAGASSTQDDNSGQPAPVNSTTESRCGGQPRPLRWWHLEIEMPKKGSSVSANAPRGRGSDIVLPGVVFASILDAVVYSGVAKFKAANA